MNRVGKALPNGPLAVVLAQIRFAPVVQISQYIPQIQDRLRKDGFPFFNVLQGEAIQPKPNGDIDRIPLTQWIFSSPEYDQNIIVDSEQLVYQIFNTREYSYDIFMQRFMGILQLFDGIVDLSLLTRFGLRYINSIPERTDLSWKMFVSKNFHDVTFPKNHDWIDNTLSTYVLQRGVNLKELNIKSNFLLRIYQQTDKRKYPSDIIRIVPDMGNSTDMFEHACMVTFLDLDHYILLKSTPKKAIFDRIPPLFDELHAAIEDVFFDTLITREASNQWA